MKICPKCKKEYDKPSAISRDDNKTEICPVCGMKEVILAFRDFESKQKS